MTFSTSSQTSTKGYQDPGGFPVGAIGHQNLGWLLVIPFLPQNHQPHRMVYIGKPYRMGEVVLALSSYHYLLPILRRNPVGHLQGFQLLPLEDHFAVELQVPYIGPALSVDVVEVFGVTTLDKCIY